jgi:hypothetical protein
MGDDVATGGTGETLTRVYRSGAMVVEVTEIDAFVNHRWLVTVRKDDGFSMAPVLARWDRSIELTRHGVSFLLYGLLDVVVDGYFEAVEAFDDSYDEVSEGIFSEKPLDPAEQRLWFQMRRALVRFHRLVRHERAVPGLGGAVRGRAVGRVGRPGLGDVVRAVPASRLALSGDVGQAQRPRQPTTVVTSRSRSRSRQATCRLRGRSRRSTRPARRSARRSPLDGSTTPSRALVTTRTGTGTRGTASYTSAVSAASSSSDLIGKT